MASKYDEKLEIPEPPTSSSTVQGDTIRYRPNPRLALWGTATAFFAALLAFGVAVPVPRPEPLATPPVPFLSAEWWLYSAGDPGLLRLDMVPVGRFGGYAPREFYHSMVQSSSFKFDEVTDIWLRDQNHAMVVTRSFGEPPVEVFETADGGAKWTQTLGGGSTSLSDKCSAQISYVARDQFLISTPGCSFTLSRHYEPTSSLIYNESRRKSIISLGQNAAISCDSSHFYFSISGQEEESLNVPIAGENCIVRALSDGRIVLASAAGLAVASLTAGASNTSKSASSTAGQPLGQQQQQQQLDPASPETPRVELSQFRAFPSGTGPLRTIRVDAEERSMVAAEQVSRGAGVLVWHNEGAPWQQLAYTTAQPAAWIWSAFVFFLFSSAGLAREVLRPKFHPPSIADELGSDNPIGASDVDVLRFRPIAQGMFFLSAQYPYRAADYAGGNRSLG
jgi:hypothetical protein